jgi:glycosyl transferase family 25
MNTNPTNKQLQCFDDIFHAYYINLEHRTDRNHHVIDQLTKLGLPKYERFNAIQMKQGAIGCSMSHLKLLQNALANNFNHVLIMEDDITFLEPELFKANFNAFLERQGNNWDVILFAGNNVPPYDKIDDVCIRIKQCLTTTGYLVNGHYLKRLIDNVKMGLTNLLHKPDKGILYAIDKFWFSLQAVDRWFLIIPPTVIQREDYSDIEKRNTNYKNLMMDIDKKSFRFLQPKRI